MSPTTVDSSWKDTWRVIGLVCGKRGILERNGVGTHGSGGPEFADGRRVVSRDIRDGLEERRGLAREHISRPTRVGYGPES